jgi:PAS domain S-box-containing protein
MIGPQMAKNESGRIAALLESGLLDTPSTPEYDDLALVAAAICETPIALVSLVDTHRQWFKAKVGMEARETSREFSFCGHAILQTDVFEVPDASADPRFHDNPLVMDDPNIRFYAGAPLVTHAGFALGTLCVIDRKPRKLTEAQRAALAALARRVIAQIELQQSERQLAAEVRARKAAEELARHQALEIQGASALQRAILESAEFTVIATDASGVIRSFNACAERLLGYRAEELVGKESPARLHDPAEFAARATGISKELKRPIPAGVEVIFAKARQGGSETRTWSYLRKDGTRFPVQVSVTAMRGVQGELIGFLAMGKDVSELQAVERMKNEFVSTVSHELRTPLTSIRGSLRILEAQIKGPLTEGALKLVKIANSNTERLIRLINDILDIEKIEAGKLELKLRTLDAALVVEKALESLRGMADAAGVHLAPQVARGLRFSGDEDRMIQVLVNLGSNAVKYSNRGDVVLLSAVPRPEGHLRFSVTDRGPGIPAAEQMKLFGKFQQLDSSDTRKRGGTGLGLAISKAIVEQHNGQVGVWSQLGRGSTFWVDLPGVNSSPSSSNLPAMGAQPDRTGDEDAPAPDVQRVLLVEDDPDVAQVVTLFLRSEGMRVDRVASIAAAKQAVERAAPALVLLDVGLPDGDGLDLLGWLRERPATKDMPAIILSGSAREEDPMGGALMVDWLQKPIDGAALATTLRRALRGSGGIKALVIEDDLGARQVLVEQLQHLGVITVEAGTGPEALRLAQAEQPDLLILDVGLPLLDGFDVVGILRQGRHRNTPLIVYSGRDLGPKERKALSLGITRHLTKASGTKEEFLSCVREILQEIAQPTREVG